MKQASLAFLLTGLILLSSCGSTADTQKISDRASESAEIAAADVTDSSENTEGTGEAAELSSESEAGATEEATTENKERVAEVEISFDYSRMTTKASNQIAVWVEDGDGDIVKTIYVSDFAGSRR